MSLASKLSHEFAARIQARGAQYFRNRAVEILAHSPVLVEAIVHGTNVYAVRLALEDNSLHVACTCPYFDGGEECKHVWATLLAADSKSYLSNAEERPRLPLHMSIRHLGELLEDYPTSEIDVPPGKAPAAAAIAKPSLEPEWKRQLRMLNVPAVHHSFRPEAWPAGREIIYLVDVPTTRTRGLLAIDIGYRTRTKKGEWSKIKSKRIPYSMIPTMKDAADRQILSLLAGARENVFYAYAYEALANPCRLPAELLKVLLPQMCATGRCCIRAADGTLLTVEWDGTASWELALKVQTDSQDNYVLSSVLRNGHEETDPGKALLIIDGLLIGPDGRAAQISSPGVRAWTDNLRVKDGLRVPVPDGADLLAELFELPSLPHLEVPDELKYETLHCTPTPHLIVRNPERTYYSPAISRLEAELLFNYEGVVVDLLDRREGVYQPKARRLLQRDQDAEQAAAELLIRLGFKQLPNYSGERQVFELTPKNLPRAVKALLDQGWRVEAEGRLYRQPEAMNMSVSSGIDWFELHGVVEFAEGLRTNLPKLLAALKRGESMVQLDDGSFGFLPEEWLKKYGLFTALGETNGDHLRFKRTQTGVLDALLAAQPETTFDKTFAGVLAEWRNFKGIKARSAPAGFVGTLRHYQSEALGWFEFLERFGFGGCLADDMGLGKTIQVLALLEGRRASRVRGKKSSKSKDGQINPLNGDGIVPRASLVVVPRSLIFNWQQEAARFTPKLKLLTHTGVDRIKGTDHFGDYDLVLTTYGTLRRDALDFQQARFDFVILDESQAIKNARTESSKAARLLKAKNRLALSGTPIENHLGELWSLFEFLNPGMLGAASVFQLSTSGLRTPDDETRQLLARALRPFILRRTKEQVAKELPEKLEQTIFCEMEAIQRKQYDELRDYYRQSLLMRVEEVGLKRSKIQVLEALLRLRQAACHPALLSKAEEDGPSAKLDVLMPRLTEVIDDGHKALVFSQFTSFLAIVRRQLDQEGIVYEYLDGKTIDRGGKVKRFQEDPDCKLFLISLKAGGQGLNLTAADYVFLLDPWWNPAVEAQAIDRAHRIGQSKRVFAYRLITRETVEEKVLALQATKRELADAIIGEDNSLIRNISGEDLLVLLS